MKKLMVSIIVLLSSFSVGTSLSSAEQVSSTSISEDHNFTQSMPYLWAYNLSEISSGEYVILSNRLYLNYGRTYNQTKLPLNHEYEITLKNAQGKFTIFNGILDVKHFDLQHPETVKTIIKLDKPSSEGPNDYSNIGFGTHGSGSFTGYSIQLVK